MMEELFAALIIGISFSNAFVCILLAFGMTSAEKKDVGKYFVFGRFLGLIILGLIIVSLGMIFDGFVIYLLIIFGVLTIIFGGLVIVKIYPRIRNRSMKSNFGSQDHADFNNQAYHYNIDRKCDQVGSQTHQRKGRCDHGSHGINNGHGKYFKSINMNKKNGFLLGVFRGATPCLKILILAPLLIVVELPLAFL